MKILFVANSGPGFSDGDFEKGTVGGAETSIIFLARELALRGHEVSIYCRTMAGGVLMKSITVATGSLDRTLRLWQTGTFAKKNKTIRIWNSKTELAITPPLPMQKHCRLRLF